MGNARAAARRQARRAPQTAGPQKALLPPSTPGFTRHRSSDKRSVKPTEKVRLVCKCRTRIPRLCHEFVPIGWFVQALDWEEGDTSIIDVADVIQSDLLTDERPVEYNGGEGTSSW